eukprot:CAMPEP_0181137962 /NCGR_PEP_ID=MMETSP1071-20121207/33984_1 /TAXON_ID=35127 /ORGANISM="Thalassiosira sp., Strain NH16" /LENGTH=425 /DNA_ID=CAMNT_0023224749 /DNA_START=178 /DNA_END=1455 /DNA_ORIENTATION=-
MKHAMEDKLKNNNFKSRSAILFLCIVLSLLYNVGHIVGTKIVDGGYYLKDFKEQQITQHRHHRPKIAVLSSFVASTMWSDTAKMIDNAVDHILNRECYCHLWNYDCIFNQTMEMGLYVEGGIRYNSQYNNTSSQKTSKNPWWLKFGAWERVAHLQAALPNYDWVLYGDLDYIIKDMSRPIESFLKEFELYGKNDIHVLVPRDDNTDDGMLDFSSFSVLIKNSPFGIRLLRNWRAFGMGLCPNGNFRDKSKKQEYSWYLSDQVGLWYALMKTHNDFHNEMYPNNSRLKLPYTVKCNQTTGLLQADTDDNFWLDMAHYFRALRYQPGNYGVDLERIDDRQMIAWSTSKNDSMSGLGVDRNWFPNTERFAATAFALHYKKPSEYWDPEMQIELSMCKRVHACSLVRNETSGMILQVGCGRGNATATEI